MEFFRSKVPTYEGDKYANLVTVFAVIAAVEYSSGLHDVWDLFLSLVSITLGFSFMKSENKKNDFFYSFLTASLIGLGIVGILSFFFELTPMKALVESKENKTVYEIVRFFVFICLSYFISESHLRKKVWVNT
jgi:general stress protein CsbA